MRSLLFDGEQQHRSTPRCGRYGKPSSPTLPASRTLTKNKCSHTPRQALSSRRHPAPGLQTCAGVNLPGIVLPAPEPVHPRLSANPGTGLVQSWNGCHSLSDPLPVLTAAITLVQLSKSVLFFDDFVSIIQCNKNI